MFPQSFPPVSEMEGWKINRILHEKKKKGRENEKNWVSDHIMVIRLKVTWSVKFKSNELNTKPASDMLTQTANVANHVQVGQNTKQKQKI